MPIYTALIAAALVASLGGLALAQTFPATPQVATIGTTDLFAVSVAGTPGMQAQYASAAQIAGVPGYVYNVPLTGFSLTFANSQTNMILNPAGTLATGTLITEPNPSDGQRECVLSTQTQTGLTWTANAGQSIANAPTALVANVPACMTYVKSLTTWERSP